MNTFPPFQTTPDLADSAPPIRALLVGCGAMSREWVRCSRELGVQIVGLVDVDLAAAKSCAESHHLEVPTFAGLDVALSDIAVDVVFDVTAPAAHFSVAQTALRAGKHVLQEKPLGTNWDEARRITALAEQTGRWHVVMQNRRFNRGIRVLQQLVANGAIGVLQDVYIDFFIGPHFGGFREKMAHPLLNDMAIHPFDAVRFLTGQNAERVFCEEWNPPNSWYAGGANVNAIFVMMSGLRVLYRGSWCAEGLPSSWNGQWRLVGSNGTLVWDGENDIRGERVVNGEGGLLRPVESIEFSTETAPEWTAGHLSVMRQFVAAFREERLPETRSSDNFHSLAMVLAAIDSAELGAWQKLGSVARPD